MKSNYHRLGNHLQSYPSTRISKYQDGQILELRKIAKRTSSYKELRRIRDNCDDYFFIRFLKEVGWEYKKAKDQVINTLEWRKSFNPSSVELHPMIRYLKMHNMEDLKAMYPYGFSKNGRPIIYMNLNEMTRIPLDETGINFTFKLVVLVLEDILEHLPKGHINFILVLDVSGVNLSFGNIIRKVGEKYSKFGEYYSGILHRAYVVNAGWVVRGLWKMASPFMDTQTINKFTIRKNPKILKDIIDEDNIPKSFGGQKCDLEFRMIDYFETLLMERKNRLEKQKKKQKKKKKENLKMSEKKKLEIERKKKRKSIIEKLKKQQEVKNNIVRSTSPTFLSSAPPRMNNPAIFEKCPDIKEQSFPSSSDFVLENPSTPTIWEINKHFDISDDEEEGEDFIDNLIDSIVEDDDAFRDTKLSKNSKSKKNRQSGGEGYYTKRKKTEVLNSSFEEVENEGEDFSDSQIPVLAPNSFDNVYSSKFMYQGKRENSKLITKEKFQDLKISKYANGVITHHSSGSLTPCVTSSDLERKEMFGVKKSKYVSAGTQTPSSVGNDESKRKKSTSWFG